MNKKMIAGLMACAVLAGAAVGGTIAWLTDKTEKVENTFTVGDINISLEETGTDANGKKDYDFVPGDTLSKDPKVTVKKDSEECWLFAKVTVANNSCTDMSIEPNVTEDAVIEWEIAVGWTPYQSYSNVKTNGTYYFYRSVDENELTTDVVYQILKCQDSSHESCAGCVKVGTSVTKGMVSTMGKDGSAKPTLTFEAAAVQKANIADVRAAFEETGWGLSGN